MERLTERTALGICGNNERVEHYPLYNIENDEHMAFGLINQCFEKLAEYEDAEEQGLLHKAPLKDGTPIWFLLHGFDEGAYLTEGSYLYGVTEYEVGEYKKDFWLSEKEAEQALAKMKGE